MSDFYDKDDYIRKGDIEKGSKLPEDYWDKVEDSVEMLKDIRASKYRKEYDYEFCAKNYRNRDLYDEIHRELCGILSEIEQREWDED